MADFLILKLSLIVILIVSIQWTYSKWIFVVYKMLCLLLAQRNRSGSVLELHLVCEESCNRNIDGFLWITNNNNYNASCHQQILAYISGNLSSVPEFREIILVTISKNTVLYISLFTDSFIVCLVIQNHVELFILPLLTDYKHYLI